jgi:hypothetical protein
MNTPDIEKLYFKETSFAGLMTHRIYNVLLYASKYDAFVLEEDGRIDELIFNEYTSLNLRYPPRFKHVSTAEEANAQLRCCPKNRTRSAKPAPAKRSLAWVSGGGASLWSWCGPLFSACSCLHPSNQNWTWKPSLPL